MYATIFLSDFFSCLANTKTIMVVKESFFPYGHKNNRNPFIDHPEWVHFMLGDMMELKWVPYLPADFTPDYYDIFMDDVVIETGFFQAQGLLLRQHAQRNAAFQSDIFYRDNHVDDLIEVFIGGVAPGSAHAKTAGAICFC